MKIQNLISVIIIIAASSLLSCHNPAGPDFRAVDRDGNEYKTVWLGGQVWMAENLRATRYRNGDEIPNVFNGAEWRTLSTGAWSYPLNSTSKGEIYGRQYNWFAVNDARGICPVGWRMPDVNDWNELIEFLGGGDVAGGKMKSLDFWHFPNYRATNLSGWSGLPGGERISDGRFRFLRERSYWWYKDDVSRTHAIVGKLAFYDELFVTRNRSKNNGAYVRCIMDLGN